MTNSYKPPIISVGYIGMWDKPQSRSEDSQFDMCIGDQFIITTNNWFYAPDGKQYRGVYGTVHRVLNSEETLGVKTNSKSTNWYIQIGNMLIAGCQIHYAVKSDNCNTGMVDDFAIDNTNGIIHFRRPSSIYNADQV